MLRTIAVLTLVCVSTFREARSEDLIHWHTSLASARQVSQQYKVPILIHFYGDQCMPCDAVERNVFTRPEVASTMQRYFVPVKINATRDRKTAAEFGVHSWPTDVFLAPDGKALSQGISSQNPNAYLQNLQNIALMNRDRNAMLAGNVKTSQPETGNQSPYGRTAANNLQQSAPGRDAAPTPYSNPSSGPNPYAAGAPASSLTAANMQSSLPSPTWQGQSAHGQAQNGLAGAGPLNQANSMTVPPPQSAYAQDNKQANIPPTVQWQTGAPVSSSPFSQSSSLVANQPKLPLAPTVPPTAAPQSMNTHSVASQTTPTQSSNQTVSNPYFAANGNAPALPPSSMPNLTNQTASNSARQSAWPPASSANNPTMPGQLVSSDSNIVRADNAASSKPAAPALDGYCPVTLWKTQAWVHGLEKHAIRHRGKVYLLSSDEAAKEFMSNPDSFTPVLSGNDPLVFLREGRLVEGSIYDGVLRQEELVFLFSSEENKTYFRENYHRLIAELEAAITQAAK